MSDTPNSVASLALDKTSGKLQPSKAFEGYIEFVPAPAVKEKIERWLQSEIAQADKDYAPIFADCRENAETYRAAKMTTEDGTEILPSPLARVAADQTVATFVNTMLRPSPLLSIKPYFPAEYNVMIPMDFPDQQGGTQQAAIPVPRDAEKIAQTWELGYEFILRERVNIARKLNQIAADTVHGEAPCWVKVCYHATQRTTLEPVVGKLAVDLNEKKERDVPDGDPIRWVVLPVYSVTRPVDEHDIQASPWMAESTPTTSDDFMLAYYNGEYALVDSDEDARKLSEQTTDFSPGYARTVQQINQKAASSSPKMRCDVREVLFYWDVKIPAGDGSKRKMLKRLSLLAQFHQGAGKLLCCYRNPYDHQLRYYVPFFQMEDAHTLSGSSTVGIIKYHQRVKTQLMGLELQNASSANNLSFFCDPDIEAFDHLTGSRPIRPNEVIPKRADEYVESWRKGENRESLLPMIGYVDNDGKQSVNLSGYMLGQNIPGRTAASTVSQILQSGAQQPISFLRTIADRLVDVIKLDLRTRRQYYPLGETIYVRDPDTQQMLEILFQYPAEDVVDNFRFAFTAADEEIAREHEIPQLMALEKLYQERANFIAQVTGPMANPNLMQSQLTLLSKILEGEQAIWDRLITLSRTDSKKFDFTDSIAAIVKERNAAMQAAQSAGPPPPQIKVSLAGKLTPEQEAQAAQSALGAPNAGNQPGGQGSLPPQPGHGGPPPGASGPPAPPPGMGH